MIIHHFLRLQEASGIYTEPIVQTCDTGARMNMLLLRKLHNRFMSFVVLFPLELSVRTNLCGCLFLKPEHDFYIQE